MNIPMCFDITPIGYVHSTLEVRSNAPPQGWEGAPAAGLEILPAFVQGVDGIKAGEEIWISPGSTKRSALFSRCTREMIYGTLRRVFSRLVLRTGRTRKASTVQGF